MTTGHPRIALISATTAAIPAAAAALSAELPSAEMWNLVDDRLLGDAAEQGGLTEPLAERMRNLIGYAADHGAEGVLLTCSLYGSVTHEIDLPIPVLSSDGAAFQELLSGRYPTMLVVASFPVALDDSTSRLRRWLSDNGSTSVVLGEVARDAFEAAKHGIHRSVVSALLAACRRHEHKADVIYLAQYSLAAAAPAVQEALGIPVVSGPSSSAAALRSALAATTPHSAG